MGNISVVRNIEVATAVVEIKTLVVGAKQFTVAMLKQLPCEPMTDERVKPWGFVNYPLGSQNYHIIFEDEGILFRDSAPCETSYRESKWAYADERKNRLIEKTIGLEQLFIAI